MCGNSALSQDLQITKCFSSLLTGEQFISFKEEKEKIFFSEEDEFSISIQYFESNDVVKDYKNGVG